MTTRAEEKEMMQANINLNVDLRTEKLKLNELYMEQLHQQLAKANSPKNGSFNGQLLAIDAQSISTSSNLTPRTEGSHVFSKRNTLGLLARQSRDQLSPKNDAIDEIAKVDAVEIPD